jgi:hypothetical protein
LQHVDQGSQAEQDTAHLDILRVNRGASTLKKFLSRVSTSFNDRFSPLCAFAGLGRSQIPRGEPKNARSCQPKMHHTGFPINRLGLICFPFPHICRDFSVTVDLEELA